MLERIFYNLKSLNLCYVTDLSNEDVFIDICKINTLRTLIVYGCGITNVAADYLRYLVNLEFLVLENNYISDVQFLTYLENIYYLDISNQNGNLDLESFPMGCLPNLRVLDISDNNLTDIGPILANPNINEYVFLYASGNSIPSGQIDILTERGVEVVT